jgi:hypothetical protein
MTPSPSAGGPGAGAESATHEGRVTDDEARLAAVLALLAIAGGEADVAGQSTALGRWRAGRLAALARDPLLPPGARSGRRG